MCMLCLYNVIDAVLCLCNNLVGSSPDLLTVYVAKHQANAVQHSGVKNVTRSRMLSKSPKTGDTNSQTEDIPAEAFLCKPQVHYCLIYLCLGFQFSHPGSVNHCSPILTVSF
jgi:hypothetical protein